MNFINKSCRLMPLHMLLVIVLFLSGCSGISSQGAPSLALKTPTHPIIHKFDLSARQGLRDITGDFSVRQSGSDTGITVLPSEKVGIFATGSANLQPSGQQSGPEGVPTCTGAVMPEPSLPCYSVIYSLGINGQAGEVGTHVGFNPATTDNIFLGINSPNLTNNTGSFHITILIISPGTIAGVWAAPANGFSVQGTFITLSAYVFAQNATIDNVQFTLVMPGQAPVPICKIFPTGGDTYVCPWNFRLNGNFLRNGPITIGFTLNGSTNGGGALEPTVNPDGIRTGLFRYVATHPSDIYAGYAATNFDQTATYQKVVGQWIVPQAQCSPDENSLSSVWVGMTNGMSDQSLLAQLGTTSGCQRGVPHYYMWWEMFPAPSVTLDQPLQPGDSVTATVSFQDSNFKLSIDDPKEGTHFSTTQPGSVYDTSIAECIAEAPTLVNPATGQSLVAQLTNFGTVSIQCQLNNKEPITIGPQVIIFQMETDTGNPKATTSDLDPTGTTFTVQWQHG